MNRKYFYVILAIVIFCLLLILIFFMGQAFKKTAPQETPTESPPFQKYLSSVGVVEPQSGLIKLTSPLSRRVEKITTAVNCPVQEGEALLQLENDDLLAALAAKKSGVERAFVQEQKLKELPRKEDLAVAAENLNKAWLAFYQVKDQYDKIGIGACSTQLCYKYHEVEASLREAMAQFEKVREGAWAPDLKIAQIEIQQAKTEVAQLESEVERTSLKSPLTGTVLQVKVREGETTEPGKTLMILGNIDNLNLRVSLDQFLVSKFSPQAQATAYREGDLSTPLPLTFLHIEPVMVPKKYLTNDSQEKIDTQVFEVLYRIEPTTVTAPLLIGEKMDVYIDLENPALKGHRDSSS